MKRFSTTDLIIIAVMAALGLGTKQIVRPIVSLITVPLAIPGGAIAGGFYFIWLVLTKRLSPKFGSGTMFGITQALVVMILPFGSHGIFTLITYSLPGIIVDLIDLLFRRQNQTLACSITEGAIANFTGNLLVLLFIFQLELLPTIFVSLLALFTGNLGGILAHYISKRVSKELSLTTFEEKDSSLEKDEPSTA
ncbi:MAG: ECF transporter S component [Candidatus Heimdallarchaeota archaeon]|nr:ECF transporter S component [Candidatus Heimdallarchaeota archaeon]